MKILYVINNAYTKGNGLATSCRRVVDGLKAAGEEVRVLSAGGAGGEKPDYELQGGKLPVFNGLVNKQGYAFAKIDDDVIREAVRWADVVHLEEPFDLQIRTAKIAKQEGKPLAATYHLHPENFYSSVRLERNSYLNTTTMLVWLTTIFNRCKIVQCPTESVARRLKRWNCKAKLRVISNGMIREDVECVDSPIHKEDGSFIIVTTGRYSREKNQLTLLKAMRYSKYADRIRLVIAGKGPMENKLQKEADKLVASGVLKHRPIPGFYTLPELQAIYRQADLYVHCATVEVEGMSCMEAIQTGLVPIIAKNRLSATDQFALSEDSLFKGKNAKDLASKIDYWLSGDTRRELEAGRYVGISDKYDIQKSVQELIEMYRDTISERC